MGDTIDLWYARADDGSTPATDSSSYGGHGFRVIFMDGHKIRYGIYRNVQAGWALGANEVAINLTYVGSSGYWFHYTQDVQADYVAQFGGTYPYVQSIQLFANCNSGYSDCGAWDNVKFNGSPLSTVSLGLTLVPNGGFESTLSSNNWLYQSAHSYGRSAAGVWYTNPYAGSYLGYTKWDTTAGDISYIAVELQSFAELALDNAVSADQTTAASLSASFYHEANVLVVVIGYVYGKPPQPSMSVTIGGNTATSLGSVSITNDSIQAWVLYRTVAGKESVVLSDPKSMYKFYTQNYMSLVAFSIFNTPSSAPFIEDFSTNSSSGSNPSTVAVASGSLRRWVIQAAGFEQGTQPYTYNNSQTKILDVSDLAVSYKVSSASETMSTSSPYVAPPWVTLAFGLLSLPAPTVDIDSQACTSVVLPGNTDRQIYLNAFIQSQAVDLQVVLNITSLLNLVKQNRQVYLTIYSVPGGTSYSFSTLQIPIALSKYTDSHIAISVGTVLDRQLYASIALEGFYDSQICMSMLSNTTYLDRHAYISIFGTLLEDRKVFTDIQKTVLLNRQIYSDLILSGYEDRHISIPIAALEYRKVYLRIQQTGYSDRQTYLNISSAVDGQVAMNIDVMAYADRIVRLAVGMVVTTLDRRLATSIQIPTTEDRQVYLKIPFIGYSDRQLLMAIKSKVTPETSTQSSGSASAETLTQSAGSAVSESSDEGTSSVTAESSTQGNV